MIENSYVSIEEANTYFSSVLDSEAWDTADIEKREKVLKMATRQLEKLPLQKFDTVPTEIQYAVCEQSLFLLKGGNKRQELQRQGVKSYSLGSLSETFADNVSDAQKEVCPEALSYLKKYLIGSVAIC